MEITTFHGGSLHDYTGHRRQYWLLLGFLNFNIDTLGNLQFLYVAFLLSTIFRECCYYGLLLTKSHYCSFHTLRIYKGSLPITNQTS